MTEAKTALEESLVYAQDMIDGKIYQPPTPINTLIAEYQAECCDFANMHWVCNLSFIYSTKMPDGFERALIYLLACSVSKNLGLYDELSIYFGSFQGTKNSEIEDILSNYPSLACDDENLLKQSIMHVDSNSEDSLVRCLIHTLSNGLQRHLNDE